MKHKETEPPAPIDPETLRAFTHSFITRFDRYSEQQADGSYRAVRQPLTPAIVEAHLRGSRTLGVYALDTSSHARWICFDADSEAEWDGLLALAEDCRKQGAPVYLELSRRGGHLWMFFASPLSGYNARRFGSQLLAEHQLETVELYPKQDQLHTGPGSLVRLPLGVHRKSGTRYPFISLSGELLAPSVREQMRLLAAPLRLPPAFVQEVLNRVPEAKPAAPTVRFAVQSCIPGDTPSERIKNQIGVYDFVSRYVQLNRGGRGLCPFHDDHVESFSVSREGNYWHCFAGCGGGSVIDFWMRWRQLQGLDPGFTASIRELAQMLL